MWRSALMIALVLATVGCRPTQRQATNTRSAPTLDASRAWALLASTPTLDGEPVPPAAQPTIVIVFASWCSHCHTQLAQLDVLRATFPGLRIIGVNYRGHEEYDGLGDVAAVRAMVAARAPWLPVVPADDALFSALGRPSKIPAVFVFDAPGALRAHYDRAIRPAPSLAELEAAVIASQQSLAP